MSIIKQAIVDLIESDKTSPPYGHDVKIYLEGHNKSIYISTGVSEGYPIYFYFEKPKLSEMEINKIKGIKLEYSKDNYFRDYKGLREVAELRLEPDYIEKLILDIFKDVFAIKDISKVKYDIFPI